jgi:maltodextrin utilization protein YvdJ
MKKILLILFVSFLFVSFSFAGGDDRDQVLPLNSLNEDYDETPNFLQEDDSKLVLSDESEAKAQAQSKLINQTISEADQDTSETEATSSIKSLTSKYLKSDQGILIMLILFVVGLILLFNFFVREKNS